MQFVLVGLSLDSAPVEILERVSVQRHDLDAHHRALTLHAGGGVLLSTCNRTEIYAVEGDVESRTERLIEYLVTLASRDGEPPDLSPHIYTLEGDDVIRHLFRVTVGLGSLALGEAQVAGQVSEALKAAGESGAIDPTVSRMFHSALRNSRAIRKYTGLGRNSLSIASIGLQLLQRDTGDLMDKTVLVVGAGETGRLTARTLKHVGVGEMIVTSRSPRRAQLLVEELNAEAVPFERMGEALARADVAIACTASMQPVISASDVAAAMAGRPERRLVVMDLGMPRDVAPDAGNIDNVVLYSLEQLQAISGEHRESREAAAARSEALIDRAVDRFKEQMIGHDAEPVIRSLGARAEMMRDLEVRRALQNMPGLDQKHAKIVDAMSKALVKRMLADPITYLRKEGSEDAARDVALVFDLDYDCPDGKR